jgi:hypothetical protein
MEERLVRITRSYAKSIALENRQRPEAFVKLVETVDGRKDGIDRGLAPPDRCFAERHDVRVVAPQPGHEAGELTKPDVSPRELCPGQVIPEQFEVMGVRPQRVRGAFHVVEIRQVTSDRLHGQVVFSDDQPDQPIGTWYSRSLNNRHAHFLHWRIATVYQPTTNACSSPIRPCVRLRRHSGPV